MGNANRGGAKKPARDGELKTEEGLVHTEEGKKGKNVEKIERRIMGGLLGDVMDFGDGGARIVLDCGVEKSEPLRLQEIGGDDQLQAPDVEGLVLVSREKTIKWKGLLEHMNYLRLGGCDPSNGASLFGVWKLPLPLEWTTTSPTRRETLFEAPRPGLFIGSTYEHKDGDHYR